MTGADVLRALLLAVLFTGAAHAQAVIFVDADAPPGGDGTSWATAFHDLQDALAIAQAGDEVWIAEGVYRPTSGSDRTATFALMSGVALYGGFDGTEDEREERDWTAHDSILSGDIGGTIFTNSRHVVTASGASPATILDGLVIEDGSAYPEDPPDDRGGGLYAPGGSPTVRNALFRDNAAYTAGGGVYFEGGSPLIEDTVFEENGGNNGGGLLASGGAPVLRRVTFRGNGGGGALAFWDGSAGVVEDALFEHNVTNGVNIEASSPVFRRTIFRDNVTTLAGYDGAGARVDGGSPRFEDCLFERLRTHDDLDLEGGGVYVTEGDDGEPARPVFVRTTFRDCTANSGGGVHVLVGEPLFLFCRFERNLARVGGGLYGSYARATVLGSAFVGNRAESETGGIGGGLRLQIPPAAGGRSLVASTLFAGNAARRGGAVGLEAGPPVDLVNVSFSGNEAEEFAGALQVFNAEDVVLRNAVLWGDEAAVGPEVHATAGAGPVIERSIVAGGCPDGATCTDVLDDDPRFLREPSPGADGVWGTEDDDYGDLRLSALSPALDGGLTALLPADVWDLDGDGDLDEPLPLDVAGGPRIEGTEVDLGAYERAAPAVAVEASPSDRLVVVPAGGGAFRYRVRLTNTTDVPQTVAAGAAALLPSGDEYGPLVTRSLTIPPQGEVTATLRQRVPGSAPSGTYEYVVFTGDWPDSLAAADAFAFRKEPGASRGRPVGGGWALEVDAVEDAVASAVAEEALSVSVAPNPVWDAATVTLTVPTAAEATVALYDALGRRVAVLHEGPLEAGRHALPLDARALPAGIYVVRVEAAGEVRTVRLTLVR